MNLSLDSTAISVGLPLPFQLPQLGNLEGYLIMVDGTVLLFVGLDSHMHADLKALSTGKMRTNIQMIDNTLYSIIEFESSFGSFNIEVPFNAGLYPDNVEFLLSKSVNDLYLSFFLVVINNDNSEVIHLRPFELAGSHNDIFTLAVLKQACKPVSIPEEYFTEVAAIMQKSYSEIASSAEWLPCP